MPRMPQDVTATELAILKVLWSGGPLAIHEISEILYPSDSAKKYSSVKALLGRLEAKGYVHRIDRDPLIRFEAKQSREDLVGRRIENLVESVCEGSISPLLTHLSNIRGLTAKQQQTLRELLNELKRQPPKRRR